MILEVYRIFAKTHNQQQPTRNMHNGIHVLPDHPRHTVVIFKHARWEYSVKEILAVGRQFSRNAS